MDKENTINKNTLAIVKKILGKYLTKYNRIISVKKFKTILQKLEDDYTIKYNSISFDIQLEVWNGKVFIGYIDFKKGVIVKNEDE